MLFYSNSKYKKLVWANIKKHSIFVLRMHILIAHLIRMKTRSTILLLLFYFNAFLLYSHSFGDSFQFKQREFINKSIDIDHIEIFFQDSIGRVWAGTYLNGMMMFDGETFIRKTPAITYNGVHCQLQINDSSYLIGTRNGLYLFNLQTLKVDLIPGTLAWEIVGFHRNADDEVLVFCASKIMTLQLNGLTTKDEVSWDDYRLVMTSPLSDDEFVLLTDNKGLYTYKYSENTITPTALDNFSPKNEMLLTLINDGASFWIGSDKGLFTYEPQTAKVVRIRELEDISVKSLMKASDGSIWVGTNNGLYIYHPVSRRWEHHIHDNQDERSLLSNCVWSIYEDSDGNKWLGVDGGISFVSENYPLNKIKWSDLINTREGNRIIDILHDSKGNYWLGGINGLGYYSPGKERSAFFKISGVNKIVNNRIRAIYEDRDGIVWIGTDGGVAWFDEHTQTFIPCNVENPETGKSAIWTYGIVEDAEGNLCLATCSGGIFIVDKSRMLNTNKGAVVPKFNYHSDSNEYRINPQGCLGIIRDSLGYVWVNGDRQIYKMEQAGKPVLTLSIHTTPALPCKNIIGLLCDGEGLVWGFYQTGFFRINPANNEVEHIAADEYTKEYGQISSMTECGDHIWFLMSKGAGVLNKTTLTFKHVVDFTESKYKSCYYDAQKNLIWLGGVDNCLVLDPVACLRHIRNIHPDAIISTVYVNEQPIVTKNNDAEGRAITTNDIAYCKVLNLLPNENNLSFRISFGTPVKETELQHGYYYRMTGLDDSWKEFNLQTTQIKYSYLQYGTYYLEIGKLSNEGNKIEAVRSLQINIQAPWYHTLWFRLLVLAAIIGLFIAGINFYRTRTKLRIAENEKANMLKLSQMKMDFLTSMSHDLKTPLSLILAPVNKLLGSTRNANSKALLQTILKNTMRLSAMVSQIINVKDDPALESGLSTSRLEIIEFVRSITFVYQEMFRTKNISLNFASNVEKLYVEADVLKLESVLNNLILNAYKFTESGGQVVVTINYPLNDMSSRLELKVSDTGIGIPAEDLPFIFDRFYQSEKTMQMNKEGSGIGLFMTRNYVVQHGGEIKVSSDESGTNFTVYLPVVEYEESKVTGSLAEVLFEWDDDSLLKLKILVVEDNEEIASFIVDNLKGMQCTVAHNGRAGLELAQQLLPDVIISDIMMPIMDGIEMSKLLKRNLTTSTIPIILLTAKDDKQTETNAYKLGVDAFLSKPFEIEHLVTRIHQLVKNKSKLISKAIQTEHEREEKVELVASQDEKFLADITRMIEDNLEDPDLNVQKLSELSGYSAKQVYRRLKMLTGHTAVDYIKSIRLKKAAMLLSQKKFTVAEVMYMVGFSTHSYFAKCFTEKYGKSPKVYMDEFGII